MENTPLPIDVEPRAPDVIDPAPAIPAAPTGGTPALDDDISTDAIPRPANELDGGDALEDPGDDPAKAG